ncbi:uncharacterized protein AB675_10613 [Cyphellophora attinorum]|uniref:Oxidase ustYa n=1 Tax=Cyphellophora attinorum TaxID=1664694 RepID=A0A0N1NZH3_9EURO|nr:uncharacterized protein AB675_10613 [Phialophora attinorum]KPI40957.1 hypothetical protein AB675_10613 [Phialophora attinorum]
MPPMQCDGATEKLLDGGADDLKNLGASSERDADELERQSIAARRRYPILQILCLLGAVFLTILAAYLCGVRLVLVEATSPVRQQPSMVTASPAYDAISSLPLITISEMHTGPDNPYSGAPNPERNELWKHVLQNYNIRVPRTAIAPGASTVHLSDESGDAWVSLSMFHHLHCLDSIRHHIHGSACPSRDSRSDADGFPIHLDHCIDTLRQWIMCQPDLTLRPIVWREDGLSAKANNTIVHQCVNWTALGGWLSEHALHAKQQLIKRPDGQAWDGPYPPPARCGSSAGST